MNVNPRISILVYLLLFCFLFTSHGQEILDRSINLPDTTCTFYEALLLLEEKTEHRFSYNADLLSSQKICTLSSEPGTLRSILDGLLDNPEIFYRVIGNQIVFFQSDYSSPENESIKFVFLKGRVADLNTGKPLAYANVGLLGSTSGTITNTEGEFILKLKPENLIDTLGVSLLGYKTYTVPAYVLHQKDMTIKLTQNYIPIQEVIIRRTEPVNLLTQAVSQIETNYPVQPTLLTAFYRETISKDKKFISVSEAILNIYKPSYSSEFEPEQIKIIRGRKNTDYNHTDTISMKLKAGLNTSLIMDVIKSAPEYLRPETMNNFKYRMSDIVLYNNDYTYAIDFTQKDDTHPPHYQGRIYIDMVTLAILGVEMQLIPEKINEAAKYLVLKKPRGYTVRPLGASYLVTYVRKQEKYYLNLIKFQGSFRIRDKGRIFGHTFEVVSELATTRTDTLNIKKFKRKEIARPGDVFTDQVGGFDQNFWGEFNYLLPEESLEEALIRINNLLDKN